MKSVVISLKSATARREHIEKEFGKQQVDFNFFDALTPDLAKPLAEKMQLKLQDNFLTPGELACFMSHVSLWQKMVDENIPHMAIFEDDVYLGQNASEMLSNSDWMKSNFGVIKLEAFSKYVLYEHKGSNISKDRKLHRLTGRHVGAAGYILDLTVANYLINLIKKISITEPLDHILFDPVYHPSMPLLQMEPALCIQSYLIDNKKQFGSGLEIQRIVRRRKESQSRSLLKKVQREFKRVLTDIHNFLVKKKVTFK